MAILELHPGIRGILDGRPRPPWAGEKTLKVMGDWMASPRTLGKAQLTNDFVLIIGAMKAGTTSLFSYLSQHPQIAACTAKEPSFFSDDAVFSRGFEWYRRLWEWDPATHRCALEASTSYSYHHKYPKTTERISTAPANFRFIYVVRNPFERIESHFNHAYRSAWDSREVTIDNAIHKRPWLIDRTKYAMQLDEYRKKFGMHTILIVEFSDLFGNIASQLREIAEFVGVDTKFAFSNLDVHNPGDGRIVEHPLLVRLNASRRFSQIARRIVPTSVGSAVRSLLGRGPAPQYRLSNAARRAVHEMLKSDMIRLEKEYGVDTTGWRV